MSIKHPEITLRHITSTPDFEDLQEPWTKLSAPEKANIQTAFLTWEWLYSWWRVYQAGHQLWLLTAWESGVLVGILPLMRVSAKKYGLRFRSLVPLGSPQCDISGILIDHSLSVSENILEIFRDYLVINQDQWDLLEFNQYSPTDPATLRMQALLQESGYFLRQKDYKHYYVRMETEWDAYFKSLSRKFRKNLRRANRLAKETGSVTFTHLSGKNATWQAFQDIISINKHAHFPLIYNSQKEQAFHKELLSVATGKHHLELFLLSIDDQPLAYEYGFSYAGRYEEWRIGYDTRFDPIISIGKLLSNWIMENIFKSNIKEIDFLRGEEAYKLEWKPEIRRYTKIRVINRRNPLAVLIYHRFQQLRSLINAHNTTNDTN